MPVYIQAKNPLDLVSDLGDWNDMGMLKEYLVKEINEGPFTLTEFNKFKNADDVRRGLQKKGYDSIKYENAFEGKGPSYIVFEPTQLKSAISNRGTFDPTNPDITKAGGGKINPLKSPREMLFELAGIPSFSKGKAVEEIGAGMYKLVTDAIEKYTKKFGRPPRPEDVQALKEHARQISQKTEIQTGPAVEARARHEMSTDPNLINPEGPDPFLTKATTGRTVKGTNLQPKTYDINDPNVQANIEARQAAGELEDILPESITPSADYLGRMGTSVENAALASGKVPMIDKLKKAFFDKNNRYPTDEELEVIIAEFNPARHQYGEKGAAIVGERPPTARGMSQWKQEARREGVPEAYLEKSPADYPQHLRDALNLYRGVQPGTRPLSSQRINPDRPFASGGTTNDMIAEMIANGRSPQRFRDGGRPKRGYEQSMDAVKQFLLGMRDAPRAVMGSYADMLGLREPVLQATPGVDAFSVPQGRLIPLEGQGSGAYETGKTVAGMVGDPVNLLFSAPVLQAAKKTAAAPLKYAVRNPVKSSVMAGAVPAASIGSEYPYEK